MTLQEATNKYPDLMEYIANGNKLLTSSQWCGQMHLDEDAARKGAFAEVAAQMTQAKADYGHYPYNKAMGEFLGLEIKGNGEPDHGYYMASCVSNHYALYAATVKANDLIAEGVTVRVVLAKDKKTGKGIRFASFKGSEIQVQGQMVLLTNAKRKVRLSSNWSTAMAVETLVRNMQTQTAYGA